MTRKKDSNSLVSQEDEVQAEHLLEHYHQIAANLHLSSDNEQADAALAEVYAMPETTQIALLKLLAKEHTTDAADLLLALHELSPSKSVRKEARRSLIRLEEAKMYPRWHPPTTTRVVIETTTNAPRFWKGTVTQAREEGEIELILCWEHGLDYGEARMLIFLLDFWKEGVKYFFTRDGAKGRIDAEIAEMHTKLVGTRIADCTLAEGYRLIQEALSINKWRGTAPHKDYRHYLPLVNQLVLEASDLGEDRGRTFINPDQEPEQIAGNFVGSWSLGDFGLAYDLLTSNSSLLEGLTRDAWVERRRAWSAEAHPSDLSMTFIHERELQESTLWLPTPSIGSSVTSRKGIEIGWSLELATTPLSGTLPEMPMGTAVSKATGRHWFWTSYTLVQQAGEWRIQSMTDLGTRAQGLSITELQGKLKELKEGLQEFTKGPKPNDAEARQQAQEIVRRLTQATHYSDALMVRLPLDRAVFAEAADQAQAGRAIERAAVYLERIAQRFPDRRGDTLRQLGVLYSSLKDMYEESEQKERSGHFLKLAEKALRDALAVDSTPLGYALLAELLIDQREEATLAEAETLLHQAETLSPNRGEETLIQGCLGNIAMFRNQQEVALGYYQHLAELSPDYPAIWYNVGHIQHALKQYAAAEQSLKRAIEIDNDLHAYTELAAVYLARQKAPEARETLEQGLSIHSHSAQLRAMLASIYFESGNHRRAEVLLEEAERINPALPMVKAMRQEVNQSKQK